MRQPIRSNLVDNWLKLIKKKKKDMCPVYIERRECVRTVVKMPSFEILYEFCLDQHKKKNDHHPEFFANSNREMSLDAKIELTCDLLSCVMLTFRKHNMNVSISTCRSIIESEKWTNWKYAVLDYLPLPAATLPSTIPKRWKKFPIDEKMHLKVLYELYRSGWSDDMFKQELQKLDSVKFYLEDLNLHKQCIYEIWKEIPEFNTPELEKRINVHDNDKLEPYMIFGYTAKWCF